MLWIKRNLFFVLSMAVGVGLIGWAAFSFYSIRDKNAAVAGDLQTQRDQLKNAKAKTPQPTPDNIQAAKDDAKRVQEVLDQFRTAYAAFPPPPKTDTRDFKTIIENSVLQLRQQASNADVVLPRDFNFTFTSQREKLSFRNTDALETWLQQLGEIKAICQILFDARITALDSLQRVMVGDDDESGSEYMGNNVASLTNELGVMTPYKITFRAYSEQIAKVLDGFARDKHCWLVKNLEIRASTGSLPVIMPTDQSQPQPQNPYPQYRRPYQDPNMDRLNQLRTMRENRDRSMFNRPPPPQYAIAQPQAPAVPVTVIAPKILFVTLSLDLFKVKQPETPTNAPAIKSPANARAGRSARPTP